MTTKEDMPKRVTDPMLEQLALLMETNRKQSEIIESQAKTIEELRATIVELNASLAWLKRKVFGKMSEKCNPINNGDPMLPFDYGDLGQIEAEIEAARNKAAQPDHHGRPSGRDGCHRAGRPRPWQIRQDRRGTHQNP